MKTKELYSYDLDLLKESGYKYIIGIDESGRGSLAGPLVISGVVLNYDIFIEGINDSKKLLPKKRKEIKEKIEEKSIWFSNEVIVESIIHSKNILKATLIGMQNIIDKYKMLEDTLILVDGSVSIPDINPNQMMTIIGGDCTSAAVAAASILAKEKRDKLISKFVDIFPEYEFDKNKGYGTERHIELIKKYGISSIHRRSFCKKIIDEKIPGLPEYEEGLF